LCAGLALERATQGSAIPSGEATVSAPQHESDGAQGTGENEGARKLPSLVALVPLPLAAPTVCPLGPADFPPTAGNLAAAEGHSRRQDRPPIDSRAS